MLAAMAPDIVNATQVFFDAVNAQGGIQGRRVRLVTLDDGYKPDNTVTNVERMIAETDVFALCNLTGTANVAAILPRLAKESPPVNWKCGNSRKVRQSPAHSSPQLLPIAPICCQSFKSSPVVPQTGLPLRSGTTSKATRQLCQLCPALAFVTFLPGAVRPWA